MERPFIGEDRVSYREALLQKQAVLKKSSASDSWSLEGAHFINLCIRRKPKTRLGINGVAELKAHVWFKDFDWKGIANRTMRAPFKPAGSGYKIDKKQLQKDLDPESSQLDSVMSTHYDEELLHTSNFQ